MEGGHLYETMLFRTPEAMALSGASRKVADWNARAGVITLVRPASGAGGPDRLWSYPNVVALRFIIRLAYLRDQVPIILSRPAVAALEADPGLLNEVVAVGADGRVQRAAVYGGDCLRVDLVDCQAHIVHGIEHPGTPCGCNACRGDQ